MLLLTVECVVADCRVLLLNIECVVADDRVVLLIVKHAASNCTVYCC